MSIKILLADDSITIQKVIGIIFGGEDYSLTVVDNGKAALDKALEIVPDIMLIDALMPGMSGYEVCERIRATPSLATKPILFLTGSFEPFDETKAKNCGADDFIAKPFESQQIIAKVTELCERATLRTSEAVEEKEVEADLASTAQITPQIETTLELESASPPNIVWDAFTPAEPPSETAVSPLTGLESAPFSAQPLEPVESPWIPIEEQSFQFEEESAAAMAATAVYEHTQEDDIAFGESPFAEPSISCPESIEPLEAPVAVPPENTDVTTAPKALELTEDQLREAITAASRDVIERIVWEVVPDLAETMIKEAIRRITENRP